MYYKFNLREKMPHRYFSRIIICCLLSILYDIDFCILMVFHPVQLNLRAVNIQCLAVLTGLSVNVV